MGAKVEIETMPGYLPTIPVDAPEELVEAAKLAAGDKYNVNVVDATTVLAMLAGGEVATAQDFVLAEYGFAKFACDFGLGTCVSSHCVFFTLK